MNIDLLKKQLERHEGLRLKPYKCTAGKLTIGYGRNLDDVGISEEEAYSMLLNDIDRIIGEAKEIFPKFDELTENRQAVICNMLFNLGKTRFLTFKKTIWNIKHRMYHIAAQEMLNSKWARQVGKRATELAQLMREG
tara:strand:+ start:25382 stop:25792 length:411 start_codon:yes stop_codon:yes gene_type:complete